ncbi:MAG TPA: hypothetical protein VIT45_17800 [Allosphingosinicella sp.]
MKPRAPRYASAPPTARPAPRRLALAAGADAALPVAIDPAATQGLVIRGYDFRFTRYLALTVKNAEKARGFILNLVQGEQEWPRVTTAQQWVAPGPNHCLNLAFTWPGLEVLGVPEASLASFDQAFRNGAKARSAYVGDVGQSDWNHWRLEDREFHVMLILYGTSRTLLDDDVALLRPAMLEGFDDPGESRTFESQALDDRNVYFGYKDGIAQPHIDGIEYPKDPDGGQECTDPSAFMLGTGTSGPYAGPPLPSPQPLGLHGCFGAFRILLQECEAFDDQVARLADDPAFIAYSKITDADLRRDAVKALMCGRWPNGTPLSIFPVQGDRKPPILLDNELNDFLYVLPNGEPDSDPTVNPDAGSHCPMGSHIRRGNMRGSPFADTPSVYHRIMRRAAAYQIPYDENDRDSGERGLMGFFMGSSFVDQFEFVQASWVNNRAGFDGMPDIADPVMGTNPANGAHFTETLGGGPRDAFTFKGMDGFVHTRASAYCFFPGMPGLEWIGTAGWTASKPEE